MALPSNTTARFLRALRRLVNDGQVGPSTFTRHALIARRLETRIALSQNTSSTGLLVDLVVRFIGEELQKREDEVRCHTITTCEAESYKRLLEARKAAEQRSTYITADDVKHILQKFKEVATDLEKSEA